MSSIDLVAAVRLLAARRGAGVGHVTLRPLERLVVFKLLSGEQERLSDDEVMAEARRLQLPAGARPKLPTVRLEYRADSDDWRGDGEGTA